MDEDFSIRGAEALGVTSSFSFDPDDEFGFHLGGGAAIALSNMLELFADYRYTFLEIDASLSGTASGPGGTASVRRDSSFDFDHGLARVGVNLSF